MRILTTSKLFHSKRLKTLILLPEIQQLPNRQCEDENCFKQRVLTTPLSIGMTSAEGLISWFWASEMNQNNTVLSVKRRLTSTDNWGHSGRTGLTCFIWVSAGSQSVCWALIHGGVSAKSVGPNVARLASGPFRRFVRIFRRGVTPVATVATEPGARVPAVPLCVAFHPRSNGRTFGGIR